MWSQPDFTTCAAALGGIFLGYAQLAEMDMWQLWLTTRRFFTRQWPFFLPINHIFFYSYLYFQRE